MNRTAQNRKHHRPGDFQEAFEAGFLLRCNRPASTLS